MTNQLTTLKKRLLQGTKVKCVDGRWSADDLPMPGHALLVVGHTRGLQCWQEGDLLDERDERDGETMDPDPLNDKIPREEWSAGLNGEPEPPWRIVYVVYLVDPETAELYSFINSTWGAQIAYERLAQKLELMARMRGAGVTALVKPDSRPMKTKFGTKLRPEFTILEWRDLGSGQQAAQLPPPTDGAAKQLPADTTKKTTGDETPPWKDSESRPSAATATEKKKPIVGKPVEPPTAKEELNDEIPDFI